MATVVRELITRWGIDVDDKQLKSMDTSLNKMVKVANIAGAAILGMFGLAVKGAAEFDTAMGEVSTLLDASSGEMGILSDEILRMSEEFGRMPVDTAKAFYQTVSAGFGDAAEAAVVMEGAMKLARGGVTDVETAADGLTTILNGYGMAVADTTDIGDKMFAAMKAGKTTIGELSKSLGKVVPFAADAGASLDELLAATATLTLGGLKTSEAVSSLKQVFAAVAKPTAEARKEAERLGIDFRKSAIRARGFARWLKDLKEKTEGEDDALAKLFGSVEGLGSVLALTDKQAETFGATLDNVKDSTGEMEKANQKMLETAGAQWDLLKAKLQIFMIEAGEPILEMLKDFATKFLDWTDSMGGIAGVLENVKDLLKAIVAFKVVLFFGQLVLGLKAMRLALIAANAPAGILAGLMAMVGGPWVLAIGLLAAAIAGLVFYWDEVALAARRAAQWMGIMDPTGPVDFSDVSAESAQKALGGLNAITGLAGKSIPGTAGGTNIKNDMQVTVNAPGATKEAALANAKAMEEAAQRVIDRNMTHAQAGQEGGQ